MSLLHRRHRDHHESTQSVGVENVVSEPNSQQQSSTKVPRRRSSGLKFFASSAAPKTEASKESHKAWEADYLKDLRNNRPARPGGSRPLPARAATSTPEPYARASSAMSFRPDVNSTLAQDRCTSTLSHRRAQSSLPPTIDSLGRPAVRQPNTRKSSMILGSNPMLDETSSITPSTTYRESGMRWMERQEARSLREAMEDMDMRDEIKIHAAAQDEASELVWLHRNKEILKQDPYQPYSYTGHTKKGAHARSQSTGIPVANCKSSSNQGSLPQLPSNPSTSSSSEMGSPLRMRNTGITFVEPPKDGNSVNGGIGQTHDLWDSPQKKAYMNLSSSKFPPQISGRRRSSGPRARNVSGGLFRNPDDKIYEEPDTGKESLVSDAHEQSKIPAPLTSKTRNVISKISANSAIFPHSRRASSGEKQKHHRFEIHRNSPSQSRDPFYLRNEEKIASTDGFKSNEIDFDAETKIKDGKEIRSDDIKSATSMRMKDRSPKLPSPTVVSDRPGRPIVSFDQNWKPNNVEEQSTSSPTRPSGIPSRLRSKPQMPKTTASAPVVPTINAPEPPSIQINDAPTSEAPPIPQICVSDTPVPSISLPDDPPSSRPLPSPMPRSRPSPANRPLPHHSSTTPVLSSKLHWSPSSRRATAQCAACALSIEGRIVSAASQRFHPHCFTCHHCAEALECVAFYPEPDSAKEARLARIEARVAGTLDEEKPGETALDDGDPSPRFYCHLDFHELFSPRCRSCKTPIESEVVIACGASWHVGHFFCAQCGDPFDAKTPFVEKDGYAWCVGCHAGRFSGKCKGCKKPVVEGGVVALGGEWHSDCFCCTECGDQFEDGRFFTRGEETKPVCVGCEERRLKA
ncbi:hypothetical protein ACLMJK_004048 [Lecanora helva]